MTATARKHVVASDGGIVSVLRGEVAAARATCGAAAASLAVACRDPQMPLTKLEAVARNALTEAGRLAGAVHLLRGKRL
jgi:hypothetical protein